MTILGNIEGVYGLPFLRKGDKPTCAQTDPELYFPPPGGQEKFQNDNVRARDLCLDCPWQSECLQWALDNNEWGIWGGTTDSMRDVIKTNLRRLT